MAPMKFIAAPKCALCNTSVFFAEQTIGPAGRIYHKPCLKCTMCKKTLEARLLLDHDGEPYCKTCHGKAFGTRGYGVGQALVADYHDPLLSNKPSPPSRPSEVAASSVTPVASNAASPQVPPQVTSESSSHTTRADDSTSYAPRASLPNLSRPTVPPKPFLGARASIATSDSRGLGSDQCPRCHTTVYAAEQVLAAGSKWHKRCLRCTSCSTALSPGQLSEKNGEPFCRHCYASNFGHLAHGLMSRPGLY